MGILRSASLIPLHHRIEGAGVALTKAKAFFPHKINDDRLRLRAGNEQSGATWGGPPATQELLPNVGQLPRCILPWVTAITQAAQSLRALALTAGA